MALTQCVECAEWREDPDEFYDGARCIDCAEEQDLEDAILAEETYEALKADA